MVEAESLPEVGYNHEIRAMIVKVTEHWVVGVIPMIYNDRIFCSSHAHWRTSVEAGWCYDKGGAAALAALAWDPETEPRPVGFKKESHDLRRGAPTSTTTRPGGKPQ